MLPRAPARQVMLSLMLLGGRAGRAMLRARPWRKVLSDIDDTLKCSGGHFPAGVDRALPRKVRGVASSQATQQYQPLSSFFLFFLACSWGKF